MVGDIWYRILVSGKETRSILLLLLRRWQALSPLIFYYQNVIMIKYLLTNFLSLYLF